ncbi:IS4 family transposase [Pistricoccus aurantiacus]|uniref:IS4 family transposase n=1 Tax=Pistricoccus aurantiacus TaxID=1883414 RepID=A0A5B8SRV4_9GAMM|nr:IS4 family transposase [Pistricoccus aurantiacus]QEA38185.1 IS4 family transposase [Pistricoccus aurantiacus]
MGQRWVDEETTGCDLGDARLNRRLGTILEAIGERPGKSLPTAFQDWTNTKAAYRFFANENVSEDKILEGHFAASALRIQATDGPILILHDTTEFSFKRSSPEKIGFTKISTGRKMKEGRHRQHTVCGLLMHASLAITPEGLPLGLTAAKFWSRNKFKGTTALKRKVNPTRVPIDQKESMRWLDNLRCSTELAGSPERCVHIGDRESDIFELFCLAQDLGTYFLVRSCVDRLAEDGGTTLSQVMAETHASGRHNIRFRDDRGQDQQAVLSVKHATMTVCPPIGKQKNHKSQNLNVIFAEEVNHPEDRPPIFWKLITNLPVTTHAEAVQKLDWYSRRWNIETFFKTLKTGCRIEDIHLTTADRLANCIALCCIVSWRISWLTILRRQFPTASPAAVLTNTERTLLDQSMPSNRQSAPHDMAFYMTAVARLGGYLDRSSDPPPGTTVLWRGFTRLADLVEGFHAADPSTSATCG